MSRQKKILPEYLSFTRKERTGIMSIMILILIFIILPFLIPLFKKQKLPDHTAFENEIIALKIQQPDSAEDHKSRNFSHNQYRNYDQPYEKKYLNKQPAGELFYFDPNTISTADWKKLGIREKTANTIQNYLLKGGRFNKPEDIGKIWGMHADDVKRLLPYIQVDTRQVKKSGRSDGPETFKAYEKKPVNAITVDINEADTNAFIALPGIGSKLANRITTFREKLGGFYKIDQVAETFALPDSVFQKIKDKLILTNSEVKKLNINQATLDELKVHPYLRYNIANAILQYRATHGPFDSVHDLKRIMIITDDIYNKAAPYLTTK